MPNFNPNSLFQRLPLNFFRNHKHQPTCSKHHTHLEARWKQARKRAVNLSRTTLSLQIFVLGIFGFFTDFFFLPSIKRLLNIIIINRSESLWRFVFYRNIVVFAFHAFAFSLSSQLFGKFEAFWRQKISFFDIQLASQWRQLSVSCWSA